MGRRTGPFATHNPWRRISIIVCLLLTVVTAFFGFVVLPIGERANAEPIWTAICSAFGLRSFDAGRSAQPAARYASRVRWTPGQIEAARSGDAHRGEFVALNCAACHGDRGVNRSGWIPNLAGMRAETMVKQLLDYGSDHRVWPVMNGIGKALSMEDVQDVAAYYSRLPSRDAAPARDPAAGGVPSPAADATVRLVLVGDPGRGIAPCGSCHGLSGLKRAAPILAGQQEAYIERQLQAFQQRTRANDEGEQMRVVVAKMTAEEMRGVATYLSAHGP